MHLWRKKFEGLNNCVRLSWTALVQTSLTKLAHLKHTIYNSYNTYIKQSNFCVNLLRKTNQQYFENITANNINYNKRLWKTIKSFISSKGLNTNKLILTEKNNPLSHESVLASMMNQYFTSITKQVHLKKISQIKKVRRHH